MVSYQAIKENFENDELGSYVSYSIAAFKIENQKRKQLTYIADVFTNKYLAEKYAQLFSQMELDPEQLIDVVNDIIGTK